MGKEDSNAIREKQLRFDADKCKQKKYIEMTDAGMPRKRWAKERH